MRYLSSVFRKGRFSGTPKSLFLTRFCLFWACVLLVHSFPGASPARTIDRYYDTEFPPDFPTLDELVFKDLEGEIMRGEDLVGNVVMIVVTLPSCPKCTSKLPAVENRRVTFEEEGVRVVAVCANNDIQAFRRLARSHSGYDWLWAANSREIRKRLGSTRSFEVFLYDRLGEIAFRFKNTDSRWKFHLDLGLGAVCERALDLSEVPNGYTGSQVCGICHEKEWRSWLETPHAHSIETLEREHSKQRLECISCHVTGEAGKETRPWRIVPRELQEVGCEECHGAGGPHRLKPAPYPDLHSTTEASCRRCHDEENSPNWNYETYLEAVLHSPRDEREPSGGEPPNGPDPKKGSSGRAVH